MPSSLSRHKIVRLSVMFLIYIITASLSNGGANKTSTTILKLTEHVTNDTKSLQPHSNDTHVKPIELHSTTTNPHQKHNASPTTTTESIVTTLIYQNETDFSTMVESTDIKDCIPPAIEQFPRPLFGPFARRHGALIIHVLVAIYTFLGLAIVCDEYFVASLDRICEELKMSPDVAGATFMAAGSSAPELATVVIGVFFAKDDIGISGVIGSAVFNIMFVISLCALMTSTAIYLNWWPLSRDCFFYSVSIFVMLITIADEYISWGEALFMLIVYLLYCVALHFNSTLEKFAQTLPIPCKNATGHGPDEQSGLVTYTNIDTTANTTTMVEHEKPATTYGGGYETDNSVWRNDISADLALNAWDDNAYDQNQLSGPELNETRQIEHQVAPEPTTATSTATVPVVSESTSYYRPKESTGPVVNPLEKPTDGGVYAQFCWGLLYPIHYLCRKTIPNCKLEERRNWYPVTFLAAMFWISFYSYLMVWMITVIGSTCGIPDTVMGMTFVAAGVSVPDALSSIAVIKEGYGDMAVSNAVGSNVFDILICLGLPWFIKTAIIKPGSTVKVISKGLTYSTLSLLSTVLFLVIATHTNGWKLDKKLGIILMAWYLIFITFASMYELNLFGYLNPPECMTSY